MKKLRKILALFLVMTLIITIVTGCSGSDKNNLVGKWHAEEKNMQVTFSKDGIVNLDGKVLNYETISDDELLISDGFGDNEILKYYFKNDKLYIDKLEFIRKK